MFSTVFEDIDPENLKAEVDFRRSGTMTSIDHQGGCGMYLTRIHTQIAYKIYLYMISFIRYVLNYKLFYIKI
jgi:hypothetical protein